MKNKFYLKKNVLFLSIFENLYIDGSFRNTKIKDLFHYILVNT